MYQPFFIEAMDAGSGWGVMRIGRAEIDSRPPFKSVKEAVMLFGERILVGEIYAPMLQQQQQMREQETSVESRIQELKAEIEEAKERLEKAREEAKLMGYCIKSLKQELLHTKQELQEVKGREVKLLMKERDGPPEINEQHLNFIANATNKDLQHKRYVQFAQPSPNKPKKKPLLPLIRWLFPTNNPTHHQLSHSPSP